MDKSTNDCVKIYKAQLEKGDIQVAYERLVKYVLTLKAHCQKEHSSSYSFGNVSPGYMDYTYFPFFDGFLRSRKLRFGIVLNHRKMCFELWLMGQNAEVQKQYWALFKTTKWNQGRIAMPKYSILEIVLLKTPDFDHLEILSSEIEKAAFSYAKEIMTYIPEELPTEQ